MGYDSETCHGKSNMSSNYEYQSKYPNYKFNQNNRTVEIPILLTDEDYQRLKTIAVNSNKTMEELILHAIRNLYL